MKQMAVLLVLFALAGCDSSSEPVAAPSGGKSDDLPQGHVVFNFRMIGDGTELQDFLAATNDMETIGLARRQLSLPASSRNLHIDGAIDRGNGGYNLDWSWHFVPGAWKLTEVSVPVCDGNAVLVEQAVQYWVEEIGRFCPAGSYVESQIGSLSETTDGLIVKYVREIAGADLERAIATAQAVGVELGIELEYLRAGALGTHVFMLDGEYPVEEIAKLATALEAADSSVEYAEPDRRVRPL